jgi:TonB-linked SusC/RagA family outer membrane protein
MKAKDLKSLFTVSVACVFSIVTFAQQQVPFSANNVTHERQQINQSSGKIKTSGRVIDSKGDPIIGATVKQKGTNNGTITDLDGRYSLEVPVGAQLEISYVGYKLQTINVSGQKSLSITLSENINELDETVVVGYGVMKKRDITGSVSQLKGDEIQSISVPNPVMALQGKIAGVVVSNNNGDPSGSFKVRIRGNNSLVGNNDPLYIIDGMPAMVGALNTEDIESIEVLKDASATAIYGSRGANGVVLITTRAADEGKTRVVYDSSISSQSVIKKIDLLNSEEYCKLVNLQQINDVGKPYFTDAQITELSKHTTNWQEVAYRDAMATNHNITVSEGSKKTRILVSGSFNDRDGIVSPGNFKRYILRSNISHDICKGLNLNLISGYTRREYTSSGSSGGNRGGSYFGAAISTPPTVTAYNDDGTWRNMKITYPFSSNALINLVNYRSTHKNESVNDVITINAALSWIPVKNLVLKSTFGLDNRNVRYNAYTFSDALEETNGASVSSEFSTSLINENTATWSQDFTDHHLSFMGGFTYQKSVDRNMGASGNGFISDIPESYALGSADTFGTPWSGYSKWTMLSYLARANYSYKGRYMATASIRSDGSSRYSKGNKWGYFPSFALAWRISDEPFMKQFTFLDDLKLRLSYGSTGSTAINAYATLNMLSIGKTAIGDSGVRTYYAASTTLPSDLKWETTDQFNIGLDWALFNSHLRFTIDWYHKMTRDLLNSVALASSTGYSSMLRNIGKMQNNGLEISSSGDIFNTSDFKWTASGNISINKNEVKKLYGGQDIFSGDPGLPYMSGNICLIREGEPVGTFYTLKEDGYDEKGRIKYVDKNNDGIINDDDKFITGDANPDFTYGFTTNLNYKGMEFGIMLQGSQGNDIYNVGETANLDLGYGMNVRKEVWQSHWDASQTPEQNARAKYPIISRSVNNRHSDRYIEDGSYLRLKDISLGYNLPLAKWKVNWMRVLKVYVSGQNLLTFTHYSGIDPEVNSYGNDVNAGIDDLSYPNTKSITFGLRAEF